MADRTDYKQHLAHQLAEITHLVSFNNQCYDDFRLFSSQFPPDQRQQSEALLSASLRNCSGHISTFAENLLQYTKYLEDAMVDHPQQPLTSPQSGNVLNDSLSLPFTFEQQLRQQHSLHLSLCEKISRTHPTIVPRGLNVNSDKQEEGDQRVQTCVTAPLLATLNLSNPSSTKAKSQPNDTTITSPRNAPSLVSRSGNQQQASQKSKRTYVSSIMQQQIVDSLQRSKEQLGENIHKTEQSYDTLVVSNEMLNVINRDAETAQTASLYSESLTKRHERRAIMERNMVRWSFLFFMAVAVWILSRRFLWFLTPAVYISKPIFGTIGIIRSIIVYIIQIPLNLFGLGSIDVQKTIPIDLHDEL